jgi:hypothetical protein
VLFRAGADPEGGLKLTRDTPAIRRFVAPAGLRHLAVDKLFVGTSSWKYEGWLDQIYSPERYVAKGRFSAKRFLRIGALTSTLRILSF